MDKKILFLGISFLSTASLASENLELNKLEMGGGKGIEKAMSKEESALSPKPLYHYNGCTVYSFGGFHAAEINSYEMEWTQK